MRTSFLSTILFLSALVFISNALSLSHHRVAKHLKPTKHSYQDNVLLFLQTRLHTVKSEDSAKVEATVTFNSAGVAPIFDIQKAMITKFDDPNRNRGPPPEKVAPEHEIVVQEPQDNSGEPTLEEIAAQKDQEHPVAAGSNLESEVIVLPPIGKDAGAPQVEIKVVVANETEVKDDPNAERVAPEEVSVQEIKAPEEVSSSEDSKDSDEPTLEEIAAQKDQEHPVAPESNLQPEVIVLPPVGKDAGAAQVDIKVVIANETEVKDDPYVERVAPEEVPIQEIEAPKEDSSSSKEVSEEPTLEEIAAQKDQEHPIAPESNLQPEVIVLPPVGEDAGEAEVDIKVVVANETEIKNDTLAVEEGYVAPEQVEVPEIATSESEESNNEAVAKTENNGSDSGDDSQEQDSSNSSQSENEGDSQEQVVGSSFLKKN